MKINPKVFGSILGLLAFLIINISYASKGFYVSLKYIKDVAIFTILFYMAGAISAMIVNSLSHKPSQGKKISENQDNSD